MIKKSYSWSWVHKKVQFWMSKYFGKCITYESIYMHVTNLFKCALHSISAIAQLYTYLQALATGTFHVNKTEFMSAIFVIHLLKRCQLIWVLFLSFHLWYEFLVRLPRLKSALCVSMCKYLFVLCVDVVDTVSRAERSVQLFYFPRELSSRSFIV